MGAASLRPYDKEMRIGADATHPPWDPRCEENGAPLRSRNHAIDVGSPLVGGPFSL
jgi:hypothetical protein